MMRAALDSIREESVQDGKTPAPSRTYSGIYKTAMQVPYDSAIFLSTDSIPRDYTDKQEAAMILLKKRIRVREFNEVS